MGASAVSSALVLTTIVVARERTIRTAKKSDKNLFMIEKPP
jgi:hypothetical protein